MIPLDTLAAFFIASLLLGLAPGPDNIFVLTQAALHGRSAGLAVVCGLCTGLIGHTLVVAAGVAAIFRTSTTAFVALKLIGAAYLLYLAWQALHAASATVPAEGAPRLPLTALYRRGIIMNLTNPKVSLFFLAFLPQFTAPARAPLALQMGLLGAVFIAATILVFGSIALLAGTAGAWINRSAATQRCLNRLAAAIFFAIALALAMAPQ